MARRRRHAFPFQRLTVRCDRADRRRPSGRLAGLDAAEAEVLDHQKVLDAVLGSFSPDARFLDAAEGDARGRHAEVVDAEHLYAALSAYLLAGIFFGLFYWVLEQIRPGTFAATGDFSRMAALYFSFVTLATLGYGDIVARTDVARGLAIVEGVGGQLFLAVMVARLVSLYAQREPKTRS